MMVVVLSNESYLIHLYSQISVRKNICDQDLWNTMKLQVAASGPGRLYDNIFLNIYMWPSPVLNTNNYTGIISVMILCDVINDFFENNPIHWTKINNYSYRIINFRVVDGS